MPDRKLLMFSLTIITMLTNEPFMILQIWPLRTCHLPHGRLLIGER
jgi:hypothetical protein